MGSLLAALATIVVTGLAVLLAVPHFVDWNDYKAQFETHAAQLVGRPVAIEGNIDLTILPVPRLSVRGLRISDEFGRFEKPFAEVEELNAVLALPPLLQGTIEARSIDLDQPMLRLKTDEFGEGTWLSIGPYGLSIPLPVREVVLNSVEITDGAIELRRAHSAAARFDRISGQFSADGLSGPFRFDGVGAIGGDMKKIQLAAVKSKGKPTLRIKGGMRSLDGVSLYQLDGEIKGLEGPVHYEGPVAARLALDQKAKKAEGDQIAEPLPGKAIELRAKAKVTLEEAKLDDINLTMTQNDRPQSVTGWAHASWKDVPRLDLSIDASWLDIDRMLGGSADTGRPVPTMVIAALPRIFEGWSFKPRQGQITAKIQQAGLNGDVVENVNFIASHNDQGWKIDTLEAGLPGEADIDVKGVLPAGDALAFNGSFVLKGKNMSRLMRWAAPSLGVVDTGNVETFGLTSAVTLTPQQLAFRNAKGSLGDSSFTGDLVHDYGETSRLLLALEAERLDLRTLYDQPATDNDSGLAAVQPVRSTNDWSAQTVPARKARLIDVLGTVFKADQSNVSLLISQLQLPDFEARNVRSVFRYETGTFDFRELNVVTTDGLKVEASGRITGFDSQPDGALKLSIDAPSAQSVTNLARLAGLDSVSVAAKRRIEALSPFKLSGRFNASETDGAMTLTLAGKAGGSELSFKGRMNGELNQFGNASIDISGGIGNADGSRLIAQLAPEVPLHKAVAQKGAGYLNVAALGTVKSGLASKIKLQTPQARGEFQGQIALMAEPAWGVTGSLELRASQAATALSMLRLTPGGAPVTGAIDLNATISKKAAEYQISNLALSIGGETVRGTVAVNTEGERPRAEIDIEAASASLPKVTAYLLDWDREDLSSTIANVSSGRGAVWPEQAFSLSTLHAFDGTIQLKAPRFLVSDAMTLSDGQLTASFADGTLMLERLNGGIYGGDFSASGQLTALKGRAKLAGKVTLKDIDLAKLSRAHGGNRIASGRAKLTLNMSGEGLSPRGLVGVVSGDGELVLSEGTIYGLSPDVLEKAARLYLNQEIPDKDQLAAALNGDLRSGKLSYASISSPITLKDGVLQVRTSVFEGDGYRANADLNVDLGAFRFDSEWVIDPQGQTQDGQPLPPVRMVFAGPFATFSSVEPTLYKDQFERFLTIKRMDRDMQRLEELNRERGIPTSAAVERVDPPQAQTKTPADTLAEPEPAAPASPPASAATLSPPPSSAAENLGGWSADTEAANTPESDARPGQLNRDGEPAPDFEAQIREVLRAQQSGRRPAYQ